MKKKLGIKAYVLASEETLDVNKQYCSIIAHQVNGKWFKPQTYLYRGDFEGYLVEYSTFNLSREYYELKNTTVSDLMNEGVIQRGVLYDSDIIAKKHWNFKYYFIRYSTSK